MEDDLKKRGVFDRDFRLVSGKRLRCGYTTGLCAQAAAAASARMLLEGTALGVVEVAAPSGKRFSLELEDVQRGTAWVSCAVRKDAGDDPDVTAGVLVYARVEKTARRGIVIEGGAGVGRVTKAGLDRKPGEAAINSTPRRMIERECRAAANVVSYTGGLLVTISIPAGVELAARTFNPRVGITGGISVLGTSGIVEPMSENAYIESLHIEIRQRYAEGARSLLVVVGTFARDFAFGPLGLAAAPCVKCSNFIGAALGFAAELGFTRLLLVGHLGKTVKLALGIVNTHSSHGDGRIEALLSAALEAGAGLETLRELAACVSTDAAVTVLDNAGLFAPTMNVLERRITETLGRLLPPETETGFIVFCKDGTEGDDGTGGEGKAREGRPARIAVQSGNAGGIVEGMGGAGKQDLVLR